MKRGYFPAALRNFGEHPVSAEDTRQTQQQLPAKTPGDSLAKALAVAETAREERNVARAGHPKPGEARQGGQGGQDYHSYLKSIARMPSVIDRGPNYSVFHTRAT